MTTSHARIQDDRTITLVGDRRADFAVGNVIRLGHGTALTDTRVLSVAFANGVTRVGIAIAAGPSGKTAHRQRDLATRAALGVHAIMARRHRSLEGDASPGVIHDAGRYDLQWGWLFGRTDGAIIKLLAVREGERVFELGCGPGNLARSLRRAVGRSGAVSAIDASPEMIDRARRKNNQPNVDISVGRAESLPYPDATFDAVVSRLVLHALGPALEPALDEISRVLRPDGRCLLVDLPGDAIDEAHRRFEARGLTVRTGRVAFPFFRYVAIGLPTSA